MPIYEFKCKKCGERFEALRPVGDSGKKLNCPDCGAKAPEKVPAVFATSSSSASPSGGAARPSSGFG